MYSINIKSRRIGYTKAFMEEMEAYYKANPNSIIMGPNSPYTKYDKPTYNDLRLNQGVHDWDDPWYVPIEWIIANPEKYQQFLDNKHKQLESWNKAFNIKPIDVKGKQILSTWSDNDNDEFRNLWNNGESSKTVLKRFFIPAYKKPTYEWRHDND